MADWLKANLQEVFSLPQPAIDWLVSLYNVIQVFDDVADGDPVSRADLDAAIWDSLAGFYQNPFFLYSCCEPCAADGCQHPEMAGIRPRRA